MPLGLRRGTVSAITEELPELIRLEVDGIAVHRLPAADRRGRGRRRRDRERAGAAARARLGRLRRPLREPDARARAAGGGGRARDGAAVHARPSNSLLQGRDGRARGLARRDAGRALHRAQPGRAGLRGSRQDVRVAYVQVAGGALPVSLSDTVRLLRERGLLEIAGRRRAVPRRRRPVRHGRGRARVGEGAGLRRGRLLRSARASSGRDRGSATARSRSPTPRTSLRRSADGRSSPSAPPRPTRASATAASRITRRPCSTWHSRRSPCRTRRDGEGWEEACAGLPLSHMGRGRDEDPAFFRAAYAAGRVARDLLG